MFMPFQVITGLYGMNLGHSHPEDGSPFPEERLMQFLIGRYAWYVVVWGIFIAWISLFLHTVRKHYKNLMPHFTSPMKATSSAGGGGLTQSAWRQRNR
eukprot:gene19067-51550_t